MKNSQNFTDLSSSNLRADFGSAKSGHSSISMIDLGEFSYVDPTHPGHDYFSDASPAKAGIVARLLNKLSR